MDLEHLDIQEAGLPVDGDSGSVYSGGGASSSQEDEIAVSRPPSLKISSQRRSKSRKLGRANGSSPGDSQTEASSHANSPAHDQVVEEAQRWAANFIPPESIADIKSPRRSNKRKKREAKPPHEAKRLRLKSYHNVEYRELLNIDIRQAASKSYQEDEPLLQTSQIGSSVWTAEEKDLFFVALANRGKNNIRDIAHQIGSKSELEVQEYLRLLNSALVEKQSHDPHESLITPVAIPAALEISNECCELLERAGDAIAARQECAEAQVEEQKWGDIWLITPEVARLLDKRRREENGEEEMHEVLPAANLFNFKNWIELSETVFMNPGAPREEDNWEELAEAGESPAIRTTGFEDFHSLAVHLTKRLVSTTLYCTMSRLRARGGNKIKHAEVNGDDVEAAVNILGLKADSRAFWKGCARRCNLQVVNEDLEAELLAEDSDEEPAVDMTYDEVEYALAFSSTRRSRSRSRSRPPTPRTPRVSSPATSPEAYHSAHEELEEPTIPEEGDSSDVSETELNEVTRDNKRAQARAKARREAIQAYEIYLEHLDRQASRTEEVRLWNLLKQSMPFELEIKAEEGDPPKFIRDCTDGENWKQWTEYWSSWETMEGPVPGMLFERNRGRKSRLRRTREELATSGELRGLDSDEDGEKEDDDVLGGSALAEEEFEGKGGDEDEALYSTEDDHDYVRESRLSSPSHSDDGRLAYNQGSPSRYRATDDEDEVNIKEE